MGCSEGFSDGAVLSDGARQWPLAADHRTAAAEAERHDAGAELPGGALQWPLAADQRTAAAEAERHDAAVIEPPAPLLLSAASWA